MLGRATGPFDQFKPIENMPTSGKIVSIHAGNDVSFLVDEHGALYSFGDSKLNTHKNHTNVPTLVSKIQGPVKQVVTGMNYAACVTQEGKLYTWGDNAWQQSGT